MTGNTNATSSSQNGVKALENPEQTPTYWAILGREAKSLQVLCGDHEDLVGVKRAARMLEVECRRLLEGQPDNTPDRQGIGEVLDSGT